MLCKFYMNSKYVRFIFKGHLSLICTFLAILLNISGTVIMSEEVDAEVDIKVDQPTIAISPVLNGIFFEDINYAADGGLYAEMVQNRSFEYYPVKGDKDNPNVFTPLYAWQVIERNGMTCKMAPSIAKPIHMHNPTYLRLTLSGNGEAGVANSGYDGGMPVKSGAVYNVTLHLRLNTVDAMPLNLALEAPDGATLAKASLTAHGTTWSKLETSLSVSKNEAKARLVVTSTTAGSMDIDMVSLFPCDTYKGRKNGLRKDLAEAIAALKPKTLRFPGGCIVHGSGLANAYRWKDSIGDIVQRRPNWNMWGYHQSYGLGYFEFMQFCEDIGATPLPILPCGVSCGFSKPYQVADTAELNEWVQDCIDLVEFANGPADSTWGKVRAAMGHPASFNLKYLGIGNEEHDTTSFRAVYPLFVKAMREKCPGIILVGTAGLGPGIPLLDILEKTGIDIYDEHYYEKPEWFIDNRHRFDKIPRKAPKVYVGEYASRGNKLYNALAEAVYLTGIERNSDQVVMTAYAPLLARYDYTQWKEANLIWFNAERLVLTPNYHVQHLFANHLGDRYLANTTTPNVGKASQLAISPTLVSNDGTVIIKLVNTSTESITTRVNLRGAGAIVPSAEVLILQGDKEASNDLANPLRIAPISTTQAVGASFINYAPPMSLQVLRIKTGVRR